jgi:hypothetical protein
MNILYFNPSSTPGAKRKLIADRCHDIVSTGIQADALRLIHNRSFDAVVIENEDEDSELLDFTLELCGFRITSASKCRTDGFLRIFSRT